MTMPCSAIQPFIKVLSPLVIIVIIIMLQWKLVDKIRCNGSK